MAKQSRIKRERAASLVKGGPTALAAGILALCQQVLGDPVSAFALGMFGAIVPPLIDFGMRPLSANERRRIDDVTLYTLREIERHLHQRHEPRIDGFLNSNPEVRSSGQELTEGILEAVRGEHQEAKLPYIGCLYASILFTPLVSADEANRLFRLFDSLTYREMCILASLAGGCEGLRKNCLAEDSGSDELASLMQECFELEGWGLISQTNYDQVPAGGPPSSLYIIPVNLRVSAYGMRLIGLAGLSDIPKKDVGTVREIMSQ